MKTNQLDTEIEDIGKEFITRIHEDCDNDCYERFIEEKRVNRFKTLVKTLIEREVEKAKKLEDC